jgi:hypothetical protein
VAGVSKLTTKASLRPNVSASHSTCLCRARGSRSARRQRTLSEGVVHDA